MDNIKGWTIDLKAVYGKSWDERKKFHLSEELWESPDQNTAALFYGIAEVGILKEVGRLAVFCRKEKPELVFRLPRLFCWCLRDSSVQFGKDGLLFVHRYKSGGKVLGVDLLAMNATTGRFAVLGQLPKKFYEVRHIEGMKYGFKEMSVSNSAEILLDLKELSWKPITSESNFWGSPSSLLRFFAWLLPLVITMLSFYVIFLFSQIPVKGTVDLVLPDGPLAGETNFGQVWKSLWYSGPVFFAYVLGLWRMTKKNVLSAARAFWLFSWTLVLLLLSPLVYMGLNSILDPSPASIYTVTVVDKYESVDINTASNPVWRLTLSSWRSGRTYEILTVAKDEFDRAQPQNSRVVLGVKPGYFGYPWIESYTIESRIDNDSAHGK